MTADTERYDKVCEILKALSNPQRLCIAAALSDDGCNVSKIVKALGIPQSTASSHITKLRNAGIIRGKRKGTQICYSVSDPLAKTLIDTVLKGLI